METLIVLLFLGALLCRLLDRSGPLTLLSAVLVLLGCALTLLAGASVWVCAVVVLVFLLLNMGVGE